jgi:hypothetical protein
MFTPDERLSLAGLGEGHETEFSGLHPNLQNQLASAQAVLREMVACMHDHHISEIGITQATEGIADAFFAAIDRTGAKAQQLGYQPQIVWTSPRVDLYEVPGAVIVSLQSSISHRAALVWVDFTEVDAGGYGDWATASPALISKYADLDAAHQHLQEIAKALRTVRTVASKLDRTRSEGGTKVRTAPSF